MADDNGERTFLRITNKDVYKKIQTLEEKIEILCQDLRTHMDQEEGRLQELDKEITWIKRIGGAFGTVVLIVFSKIIFWR